MLLQIFGIPGIPEVGEGDDIAALIAAAAPDLADGDVLVVTSKIVSKAERRLVAGDREAAITAETVRVVARRGMTRIVQTRQGLVLAAAGVDTSNVPPGVVALLPVDPDASARRIRAGVLDRLGADVAVLVTDTMGRPWRNGLVDVCIGAAGIDVLADLRGRSDPAGHVLDVTVTAVGDELAAAAELVKGKLDGVPVAVVRGWPVSRSAGDGGARPLLRPPEEDLFRLGTAEAGRAAVLNRRAVEDFADRPVDEEVVGLAVGAALGGAADSPPPWRFVDVRDRRDDLVAALGAGHEILAVAPVVLLPFLVTSVPHATPAQYVATGDVLGSLRIALAADGIGSAWLAGPLHSPDVVRRVLDLPDDWACMGAIAIGHPASATPPRLLPDTAAFLLPR